MLNIVCLIKIHEWKAEKIIKATGLNTFPNKSLIVAILFFLTANVPVLLYILLCDSQFFYPENPAIWSQTISEFVIKNPAI